MGRLAAAARPGRALAAALGGGDSGSAMSSSESSSSTGFLTAFFAAYALAAGESVVCLVAGREATFDAAVFVTFVAALGAALGFAASLFLTPAGRPRPFLTVARPAGVGSSDSVPVDLDLADVGFAGATKGSSSERKLSTWSSLAAVLCGDDLARSS
ncbi:hypothetical protein HG531_010509 [Fusarium graminearum]|nr:hypothetical protein HG531_010509 [Fusarium graminearum]